MWTCLCRCMLPGVDIRGSSVSKAKRSRTGSLPCGLQVRWRACRVISEEAPRLYQRLSHVAQDPVWIGPGWITAGSCSGHLIRGVAMGTHPRARLDAPLLRWLPRHG